MISFTICTILGFLIGLIFSHSWLGLSIGFLIWLVFKVGLFEIIGDVLEAIFESIT